MKVLVRIWCTSTCFPSSQIIPQSLPVSFYQWSWTNILAMPKWACHVSIVAPVLMANLLSARQLDRWGCHRNTVHRDILMYLKDWIGPMHSHILVPYTHLMCTHPLRILSLESKEGQIIKGEVYEQLHYEVNPQVNISLSTHPAFVQFSEQCCYPLAAQFDLKSIF